MPEYIRLDMFPATVTRADGSTIDPARVIVTEDTLYVFKDNNPTPALELSALLYDFESISRTRYKVVTDDEREEIVITKRAGCGCGNKLKGFRAFPGVPLRRDRKLYG